MKTYPNEYICPQCKKRNHKFLRCFCWAKDESDWPHEPENYDYSFVSTCTVQVQWIWDDKQPLNDDRRRLTNEEDWGFAIDYIPEVIVMNQPNPFEYVIWTPEEVAYNLKHATRIDCRYTEEPRWNRYHVYTCGNIIEECHCCCGDNIEEDEFYSPEEMKLKLGFKDINV